MASVTIEDIAELAQISRATVSRVLNNHPHVRPAVRERVLRIINEQGYVPHAAARSLARRRTNVIGLVMSRRAEVSLVDPFVGLLTQSIIDASARLGYFVMLTKVTAGIDSEYPQQVLRGQHFDGVITFAVDIDDPLLRLLRQDTIPLVIYGSHPYLEDVTSVDAEQYEGAHGAVQHLISLGHRYIATITGMLHDRGALDRRDGYLGALQDAGLPIASELIVEGDWTLRGGYTAMQHLLRVPERPTAVFVANDMMALGAMRAINEAGLTVPHDVALVAFDDLPVALYANPPLSTVHLPIVEGGTWAAKLLVDQLELNDRATTHVRLPTQLIIRGSCGASAPSRG